MSTGNNLHNSFKKAFENHEAPLNDAQWLRLEKELGGKAKKWNYLPYLFSALIIVAIFTGIFTYNYIYEKNNSTKSNKQKETLLSTNKYKTENERNNHNTIISKQQLDENKNLSETLKNTDIAKYENKINGNIKVEAEVEAEVGVKGEKLDTLKKEEKVEVEDEDKVKENISKNESTETKPKKEEKEKENIEVSENLKNYNDSTLDDKNDNLKPKSKPKYVFSISTGYSNMNVKVTSVDELSKVHKDTRKVFEMSNKNTQTLFVNLGFDCNIFKGFNIGLNTGLQYLHIKQPVNVSYRMLEIPFYDINRNIIGYIPKDSATAEVLSTNTNNTISYIKIPLRFNYTIPFNSKSEMLITAGTNISTVLKAKGSVISINDGLVKPLSRSMFGKLNFGLLGGLQYCRQIKNQWWMGFENQWQLNPEKYINGNEKIRNRLSGYNINLILKYKI